MDVEAALRTWAQVLRERIPLRVSVERRLLAAVVVLLTHEAVFPCSG